MKRVCKLDIKQVLLFFGVIIILFISACMYMTGITVPLQGTANDSATFTMHCYAQPALTDGDQQATLVAGFLAPKGWNAAQNTIVTYISDKGNGIMTLMPKGSKDPETKLEWPDAAKQKMGIGGNLIDDVEWVIFLGDRAVTASNQVRINYDVSFKVKLGPNNMFVKLGFFNATLRYGFAAPFNGQNPYYAFKFSDCFQVIGGDPNVDLEDMCNPQMSTVTPVKSLDNDIITLTFDNGLESTALDNESDIYVCVTGYKTNGDTLSYYKIGPENKLNPLGGKKYRIDFWPRGLLKVGKNETLKRLVYKYYDVTGTKAVINTHTLTPFQYTFKCTN